MDQDNPKVRIPILVQDPHVARFQDVDPIEYFDVIREDHLLDGPVCRRVAVVDLNAQNGKVEAGARLTPPGRGRKRGGYGIADPPDLDDRTFNQVSVFGTVLKTMYMFEEADTLGRPVSWGFGSPQLLVVPRAGEWANAFYERASRSLQFFHFNSAGRDVFTSLSRDIVSHETGHALLDGIAPDLYNAITPQSLAIHEAVADITALLLAFRSGRLREKVLEHTNGSIENSTAFSSIAEEFGQALARPGYLRSLLNNKNLDPEDPLFVPVDEPHELSEVLSGALYKLMCRIHASLKEEIREDEGLDPLPAAGKALGLGAERLKRMVLRALDHLPPGDVTFLDYGRAVIAADQVAHPDASRERDWLKEEFVRRHIAPTRESLEVETNFEYGPMEEVDLQTLVESDWAAYRFVDENREFLGLPPGVPFTVRPRLDVAKLYYQHEGPRTERECIFKVMWAQIEPNDSASPLPPQRIVPVGTTVAIDWETKRIRARLPSTLIDGSDDRSLGGLRETQQMERTALLDRMLADQVLVPAEDIPRPLGRPLRSVVEMRSSGGVMKVTGSGRMLHVAGGS